MKRMKKDYRKGSSSSYGRKMAAHYAIRQSLERGQRTFSELLSETGLGRSTLAFHLKGMFNKREVDKITDPKDCRITIYNLKRTTWTPELQKEYDIETINSMKAQAGITSEFLKSLTKNLPPLLLLPLVAETRNESIELSELVKEHMNYSIYSTRPGKDGNNMEQIGEKAALASMKELLLEPRHLEELSDFCIVLRFRKLDKLAKRMEEQDQQPVEGLNLPEKPR